MIFSQALFSSCASHHRRLAWSLVFAAASLGNPALRGADGDCNETVTASHLRIDEGHPWQPPFGLDRVGKAVTVKIEVESDQRLLREYFVVGYTRGEEVERKVLSIMRRTFDRRETEVPAHGGTASATFEKYPDEVALFSQCRFEGKPVELARIKLPSAKIQAEAVARPEKAINPVDLGTIFVPQDWLILAAGQKTMIEAAAISYGESFPKGRVDAWFESAQGSKKSAPLAVKDRERSTANLVLEPVRGAAKNDVLHVALFDGDGSELWHKKIETMLVPDAPKLPAFGATALKLRYDPPISLNTAGGGKLEFIDYDTAWDASLNDVVVTMPTGGRFVFWRGSSYIPFWAGQHNTGMCYEWAETTPPPDGFVDSIEPLMDKELRYGRVEIIESTPSRVHVRWTYQSTDFNYKVWGDQGVEDFYFYPDGFGTRVLSLKRNPGTEYELSEFIVLTPQSAYPFDVLPKNVVDMVYLDGQKHEVLFPDHALHKAAFPDPLHADRKAPVVYRIRLHKEESASAVYFYPSEDHFPMGPFAPFYDRGYLVTPAYWGSHWPLSRGKSTGWSIDDRIHHSPAHNSLLTWGTKNRPTPLAAGNIETIDTLGQAKVMTVERWAWLIGMSEASDARLIEWAHSFSRPPSLELSSGAELAFAAYAPERRAMRLRVTGRAVSLKMTPNFRTVNPVFELMDAPAGGLTVELDGKALPQNSYAWDGKTLWIDATISEPAQLKLTFAGAK